MNYKLKLVEDWHKGYIANLTPQPDPDHLYPAVFKPIITNTAMYFQADSLEEIRAALLAMKKSISDDTSEEIKELVRLEQQSSAALDDLLYGLTNNSDVCNVQL